jgi:Sister chromatid cohesion protein Dcc1
MTICSDSSTYNIRLVETSNALMICKPNEDATLKSVNDLDVSLVVQAIAPGHHEMKQIGPPLHKLRALLSIDPYRGNDPEPSIDSETVEPEPSQLKDVSQAPSSLYPEVNMSLAPNENLSRLVDSGSEEERDGALSGAVSRTASKKRQHSALAVNSENAGGRKRRTGAPGYTFSELLSQVPCSRKELEDGLASLHAVLLESKYRLVDSDLQFRILKDFFLFIESKSWSIDRFDLEEMLLGLQGKYHSHILRHVFQMYSVPSTSLFSFSKVAAIIAVRIMEDHGKESAMVSSVNSLGVSKFMALWKDAMPIGMVTGLEASLTEPSLPDILASLEAFEFTSSGTLSLHLPHVRGKLLPLTAQDEVCLLLAEDLPADPAQRFKLLFKLRPKWSLFALEPYVKPLVGPSRSIDDLLLAHTRVTLDLGKKTKTFSAR